MYPEDKTPPTIPPAGFEPLEGGAGLSNVLNKLLKKPLSLVHHLQNHEDRGKLPVRLLVITILALAVFGLVAGSFSAGSQLWAAPVKMIAGLLLAALLCLPSLYIFTCLGGIEARFLTVAGMLCAVLALVAVLLVGFAPVVWLFSVSSTSLAFMGFLLVVLWLICAGFGLLLIFRGGKALGMTASGHMCVWGLVFLLVTLQMPTTLRPIIGPGNGSFLNLHEKRFFLGYWIEQFSTEIDPEASRTGNAEGE
ncbi:MAG: hypothetical protein HKN82_07725 [Akkermansiaceae bacterium]|nr:hypothetical protein [Akkermansiaceae bacterium]NNM31087.1 hypothetical protein [Akkermansiaceae bacterium]